MRYIAFLRAINVGGHTVQMSELRKLFEKLGYSNVETFIASGNVVFQTEESNPKVLAANIATALRARLGYDVATFLRSDTELAAITAHKPFRQELLDSMPALNIAFVAEPVSAAGAKKLAALESKIDLFIVHGREIYWLCKVKQSESKFSNAVLEKALGVPATMRGVNTVRKLVAKLG
jgi:uncharacterized protein (DUF1697 family)